MIEIPTDLNPATVEIPADLNPATVEIPIDENPDQPELFDGVDYIISLNFI